jgi:hypothetical protein
VEVSPAVHAGYESPAAPSQEAAVVRTRAAAISGSDSPVKTRRSVPAWPGPAGMGSPLPARSQEIASGMTRCSPGERESTTVPLPPARGNIPVAAV